MNEHSKPLRLFFGHQSVGSDVLHGVREQAGARAVPLITLTSSQEPAAAQADTVLHAKLGTNGDPASKLAAFESTLSAGIATQVDCAMFKLCYVDITTRAAAEATWQEYATAMERIESTYPLLRVLHCTVPLRALPSGVYATLRRVFGHRHAELDRNRAREAFNDRLRARFPQERLFDLALAESRRSNGERCIGSERVPGLVPAYTHDGGHLNMLGRRVMANAFLDFFDSLKHARAAAPSPGRNDGSALKLER